MILVTGLRTTIMRELKLLLPTDETITHLRRDEWLPTWDVDQWDRCFFAAGVISELPIWEQDDATIARTLWVNFVDVVRRCEFFLRSNNKARICVMGSASAWRGSYDQVYAGSKAALHAYVMARKVLPTQQLVCISPPLISDAGMTLKRHDYPQVLAQRRTVTSAQVAELAHRVLYLDPPGGNSVKHMGLDREALYEMLDNTARAGEGSQSAAGGETGGYGFSGVRADADRRADDAVASVVQGEAAGCAHRDPAGGDLGREGADQ